MSDDYPGVIPHLTIADRRADEAIAFYERAFGAELVQRMPTEDGRLMHAHLKINGGSFMLNDDFPEYHGPTGKPAAFTLHVQVVDADAAFDRATAAGATVTMPLDNQFWGDRYGQVEDPFGFRWSIGGPVKD